MKKWISGLVVSAWLVVGAAAGTTPAEQEPAFLSGFNGSNVMVWVTNYMIQANIVNSNAMLAIVKDYSNGVAQQAANACTNVCTGYSNGVVAYANGLSNGVMAASTTKDTAATNAVISYLLLNTVTNYTEVSWTNGSPHTNYFNASGVLIGHNP